MDFDEKSLKFIRFLRDLEGISICPATPSSRNSPEMARDAASTLPSNAGEAVAAVNPWPYVLGE